MPTRANHLRGDYNQPNLTNHDLSCAFAPQARTLAVFYGLCRALLCLHVVACCRNIVNPERRYRLAAEFDGSCPFYDDSWPSVDLRGYCAFEERAVDLHAVLCFDGCTESRVAGVWLLAQLYRG